METSILQIAKFVSGPVIGSVIGYFTNYIAVKMLFYPKKEIHIFKKRLPFTPGVIPKGKDRIANAIGSAVGSSLLTKEDLKNKILSSNIQSEIDKIIEETISKSLKDSILKISNISESDYSKNKEKLENFASDEIVFALSKIDISELLSQKGLEIIKEKITNPMLKMFITDELILSILSPLGFEVQEMIKENGKDFIKPQIQNKFSELELASPLQIAQKMKIEESELKNSISLTVKNLLSNSVDKILEKIDITQIVKSKIEEMDIDELEDLILKVMKKELNTIVNLGALIGFLLGLFNIIF